MTTEAKVGAFTIIALFVLGVIVIHLSGFSFSGSKAYAIDVLFDQVNGLRQGGAVRYAGVEVGTVQSVAADGHGAKAVLKIDSEVKIPRQSVFSVSSDGVMGEKFISITPSADATDDFLKAGEVVQGSGEQGIERMMGKATQTMEEMQKLMKSINDVLGNQDVKDSMVQSAINIKELTGNLSQMTLVMQRMAVNNEQDLRGFVSNLNAMSASMVHAADGIDQMITDFSGSGQTAADLRQAVQNLSVTSTRIERMAANVEPVISDPQTMSDLKEILRNTRNVTARADSMLGKVGSIKTEAGADFLYSGGKSDWMANADFRIYPNPDAFLLLGVDDIGDGNKSNVQLGSVGSGYTTRAGLFDDKFGLGLDVKPVDDLKLSLEASNPDDLRLRVKAQYQIAPDLYLLSQTDNVNKKSERASYFGIRHTF